MSFDAELIPAAVITAIVFLDRFLGCLKRVVRSVEGGVKQKRFVLANGFFKELNSEVSDGVRCIEGTAVECRGNIPLLSIESKRVVSGEKVGGARQMPPVALETKVSRLLAEVPLTDHSSEIPCVGKHFRDSSTAAQLGAAGLIAVKSGQQ
jgi:hypothetical protein